MPHNALQQQRIGVFADARYKVLLQTQSADPLLVCVIPPESVDGPFIPASYTVLDSDIAIGDVLRSNRHLPSTLQAVVQISSWLPQLLQTRPAALQCFACMLLPFISHRTHQKAH